MERILVVEDEPRLRDIIRDYFCAHGLDCVLFDKYLFNLELT